MARTLPANLRIEPLSPSHDRTSFCCGKSSLDDFLRHFATQYEKRDAARTYVALVPEPSKVLGYYTLSAGAVAFASVPSEVSRKLPRHPVPTAHLGRLAVDQTAQGRGLGEFLLVDAFKLCWQVSEKLAIHALEVFALDDDARNFYLKYGFQPLLDDRFHLYLTMKKIRQLPNLLD